MALIPSDILFPWGSSDMFVRHFSMRLTLLVKFGSSRLVDSTINKLLKIFVKLFRPSKNEFLLLKFINIVRQIYILLFWAYDFSLCERSNLLLLKSILEAEHHREVGLYLFVITWLQWENIFRIKRFIIPFGNVLVVFLSNKFLQLFRFQFSVSINKLGCTFHIFCSW